MSKHTHLNYLYFLTPTMAAIILFQGCGKEDSSTKPNTCSALTGSTWIPSVAGVSSSNRDSSVTISTSKASTTGALLGLSQPPAASKLITFTFDMSADLGAYGSLTLVAKASAIPADVGGNAYALLMSLSDGVNEWINTGSACSTEGPFSCTSSGCGYNANCVLSSPSAYGGTGSTTDTDAWLRHQITNISSGDSSTAYPSVNIFPTCNWTTGSPTCAFNSTFFPSTPTPKRMRFGTTYTAKYALYSNANPTLENKTATMELSVIRKIDSSATIGGAIDLNVILVGSKTIQSSRVSKGQVNLNELFSAFYAYYNQSNTNIKLGSINVIEWTCEKGGDSYSTTDVSKLGAMFGAGSAIASSTIPSSEGRAVNLFLLSNITNDSDSSSLTVLGLSGGLGGPPAHGFPTSGVAISAFDMLDKYNKSCTGETCPVTLQEVSFVDMGVTIAHEVGHYFGLFHPSESDGTEFDAIPDTPKCTARDSGTGNKYITIFSCLNSDVELYGPTSKMCRDTCTSYNSATGVFCPEAIECQFNHVMWWTSKKFKDGKGDGNIFSAHSSAILNYNPFVQ